MEALRIKGFAQRWIDWMSTCVYSDKSCVLLNSSLGKEICCRRGFSTDFHTGGRCSIDNDQ